MSIGAVSRSSPVISVELTNGQYALKPLSFGVVHKKPLVGPLSSPTSEVTYSSAGRKHEFWNIIYGIFIRERNGFRGKLYGWIFLWLRRFFYNSCRGVGASCPCLRHHADSWNHRQFFGDSVRHQVPANEQHHEHVFAGLGHCWFAFGFDMCSNKGRWIFFYWGKLTTANIWHAFIKSLYSFVDSVVFSKYFEYKLFLFLGEQMQFFLFELYSSDGVMNRYKAGWCNNMYARMSDSLLIFRSACLYEPYH